MILAEGVTDPKEIDELFVRFPVYLIVEKRMLKGNVCRLRCLEHRRAHALSWME